MSIARIRSNPHCPVQYPAYQQSFATYSFSFSYILSTFRTTTVIHTTSILHYLKALNCNGSYDITIQERR